MAFKMNGWSPFTKMVKGRKLSPSEQTLRSGRHSGVTRTFKEKPEFKKSKFRKKIESGKGIWAKLFGGKREGDVYKPGIADFRLFGGTGHRNLKKGDTAANTKKKHSSLNWKK
tara:strand:- start:58 stop:396 length:339 start_codon:yes stop_codon:yes gene_type:complete